MLRGCALRGFATYFDTGAKRMQKRRARQEEVAVLDDVHFLRREYGARLLDRLDDIVELSPTRVLELGGGGWRHLALELLQKFPSVSRYVVVDDVKPAGELDNRVSWVESAIDGPLQGVEGQFDLVVSNLALHWCNDLEGLMRSCVGLMKPNCVFIGSMWGAGTLDELRSSFVLADTERKGGVLNHMSPLITPDDLSRCIQAAGFVLPTIDADPCVVAYENLNALFRDLYLTEDRGAPMESAPPSRENLVAAMAIYNALYRNSENVLEASLGLVM